MSKAGGRTKQSKVKRPAKEPTRMERAKAKSPVASQSKGESSFGGMSRALVSRTELIVALDVSTEKAANDVVAKLSGLDLIFKVGLELFCAVGPEWVKRLAKKNRVFLDLKFHDIPNTVAKASAQMVDLGVEMFTYHLASGPVAVKRLHEAIDLEAARLSRNVPLALGVTVLTSFDESSWSQVTLAIAGKKAHPGRSVEGLLSVASQWNVRGIVCSPHELDLAAKLAFGVPTVVPGVRPLGAKVQDQARVMTPAQAASLGAFAVVMGRPILESQDPYASAKEVIEELKRCAIKV